LTLLDVQYEVADARKLNYDDGFFDVIIDKGTLDAMLSDKEYGVSNCKAIVAEVARVLSVGGYFMLISHLNANTSSGIEWIDEILVSGLRTGGDKSAKWVVECHSADMNNDDSMEEMDEEGAENGKNEEVVETTVEDDKDGSDDGSSSKEKSDNTRGPGPAVYIISKLPFSSSNDDEECKTDEKDKKGSNHDDEHPPTIPLKFFTY